LRKLKKVLGDAEVAVDLESPAFLDEVSEAARSGRKLVISYAGMASGEL
jgi:hypothetical protein